MHKNKALIALLGLVGITILSGVFLISSDSFATDNTDVVDEINITVPVSCSLEGTGMTSHNANIVNGTYQADIGSTTLKAFCNDEEGFAIYAIGYTDDEYGKTVLTNSTLGSTYGIATGTATSGNTSNWAMKLATNSSATYPITIDNSFDNYHAVPSPYAKVAHRDSGTDIGTNATGAELTSTYAAFMSQTQPAGTYSGKVKYTLVHPSTASAPMTPPSPSTDCNTPVPNLTYMQELNSSNKSSIIADMEEDQQYYLRDNRDEKPYCVALLKDGNIWMTQNLDHDIKTDGTVIYDSTTTDIPSTWTPSTATYATGTTTWDVTSTGNTTPQSYDPGNLYWSGIVMDDAPVSTGSAHYHLGNYYNWTAAVAMNNSSSYTTRYQDVDQSICPANWTLPKSGNNTSNGTFRYLVSQYGWTAEYYEMQNPKIWDSAIKAPLSDSWEGSLGVLGNYGYFWSSTIISSSSAYILDTAFDGNIGPSDFGSRYSGINVRCVSR